MTSHLGTFIPLQAQPTGWGSQSLNQNANWGLVGWNPGSAWNQTAAWNPTATWNQIAAWNPVTSWEQNASQNTQAPVAFIPHHSPISGGSFVPSSAAIQGITAGAGVVGVPSGWQGVNPALGGSSFGNAPISQSFAAELSETNHEFVLSFDVPGIDVEDLDVSLSGNTIFINGIRKGSQESTTLAYSEIAKGNITRAIAVPFDVSPNKAINTSLDNGVLKIRIAKESQSDKRTATRKVKIG